MADFWVQIEADEAAEALQDEPVEEDEEAGAALGAEKVRFSAGSGLGGLLHNTNSGLRGLPSCPLGFPC